MRSPLRRLGLSLSLLGVIAAFPLIAQQSQAARSLAGLAPIESQPTPPEQFVRPGSGNFGTTSQVLQTIAAKQFVGIDSTVIWADDNNAGLYRTGGSLWFDAAVDIPAGSRLDWLEIEACNDNATVNMIAWVFDMASPMGIVTAYPADGVVIAPASGCGFFINPDPLGLIIDRHNSTQMVRVRLSAVDSSSRFRAVRLYYTPQISPAPAVASFNDVATNHPFFQYVEALKAAGITGGCQASPPLYCPDNPVTRGQMAVFLSKLVGLYWPY